MPAKVRRVLEDVAAGTGAAWSWRRSADRACDNDRTIIDVKKGRDFKEKSTEFACKLKRLPHCRSVWDTRSRAEEVALSIIEDTSGIAKD